MNKSELIENIASKTDAPKKVVAAVLDAFVGAVQASVKRGEDVTLIGFGSFKLRKTPARNGRNPATGEKIKIKSKKVMRFSTSPAFNRGL